MILQPSEIEADHQLIQMCLYGDERAWQALVDRYKRLVFSIARTYGGRGNADAIFESIWQTALENLENLGPGVSFRYWLTAFTLRRPKTQKRRNWLNWDLQNRFRSILKGCAGLSRNRLSGNALIACHRDVGNW